MPQEKKPARSSSKARSQKSMPVESSEAKEEGGKRENMKSITLSSRALSEFGEVAKWKDMSIASYLRQILETYHESPEFKALLDRVRGKTTVEDLLTRLQGGWEGEAVIKDLLTRLVSGEVIADHELATIAHDTEIDVAVLKTIRDCLKKNGDKPHVDIAH